MHACTRKWAESYDQFAMLVTSVCAVIRHSEHIPCFVITLCIYTAKVCRVLTKNKQHVPTHVWTVYKH